MNIPQLLKTDPHNFVGKLLRRGVDAQPVLTRYDKYRQADTNLQDLRAEKNALRFDPNDEETRTHAQYLKEVVIDLEHKLEIAKASLQRGLDLLPNVPDDTIPDGQDENDNQIVGHYAIPRRMDFTPKEHHILLDSLMNKSAAAMMTGARFSVLNGRLAKLHRALGQLMLDIHTTEHGFNEVSVPYLVNEQSVYNTGQLPKFKDDLFETVDGRYLIPTAEVSLTNIVAHQVLTDTDLPMRFVALTPCFRREAGSAGRDTHGLIRQHQFEKCELVTITTPDQSDQEHEHMLKSAESILTKLSLPYRRVLLCAGDMGFASQKTYDLEVWMPGQNKYREISSVSNCGEFQARRMNARFKKAGIKGKSEFVHTLNGSGLAVGRTLAAVVENYQQADGSILIPNALQKYMGGCGIL